jgi:hypothetical protein
MASNEHFRRQSQCCGSPPMSKRSQPDIDML